ncbi:carboxylesterase/lipase family protein [Schumannella soli]|uniref:carboxylesterase/lipase family protein n=1 Tax=Schumannella soli TaxID=2590779 RepID=UPI0015E83FA2|nr:carboxylesterase/lipase family protein [Schumannella soli]
MTDTAGETQLEGTLTVSTTAGVVEGVIRRGLRMWRGIPYAAPPVGARRLRAPEPALPWSGVRPAIEFGPVAPQDPRGPVAIPTLPSDQDEDCLTLNVIAPRPTTAKLRPVMVFVHGGAFSVGSSREMPEQGEGLVHDGGVVFVNLNYRLAGLGWLDFSRYGTAERPIDANLGLRDVVAALEWIRDNIAAFGGDPDNVTLFGESAGAGVVTTLMTAPAARGLFAKAIAESSPVEAVYSRELQAEWAADFVRILREVIEEKHPGVTAGRSEVEVLDHAAATAWVIASQRFAEGAIDRTPGTVAWVGVLDGDFLPQRPTEAFADGSAMPIPLIIGTNDREGSLFRGRLDILATTPDRIRAILSGTAADAVTALTATYPGLPKQRHAMDLAGDHAFWFPSVAAASGHSRYAPTYMYRFDLAPRLARLLGLDATHGIELFAVFDKARSVLGRVMGALGGYRDFERAGRRVRTNWLHFAYAGEVDPGWPRYDEQSRLTLIIDVDDRIESDPRGDRRRAWERFVPHV